jgi:hypothetical protein
MNNKRTLWMVAGIMIAVLVIGVLGWLFFGRRASPRAAFAPAGQLTAGFPKDLILGQAATLGESYAINYSPAMNQYTANWTATSSLDDLYRQYTAYFISHGWKITNANITLSTLRSIYAATSTADANVVITSGKGGLKVSVSYIKK